MLINSGVLVGSQHGKNRTMTLIWLPFSLTPQKINNSVALDAAYKAKKRVENSSYIAC